MKVLIKGKKPVLGLHPNHTYKVRSERTVRGEKHLMLKTALGFVWVGSSRFLGLTIEQV